MAKVKAMSKPTSCEAHPKALLRFSVAKQRRLNTLMAKNNNGRLTDVEQAELQALVREVEEMTLANARMLASQR